MGDKVIPRPTALRAVGKKIIKFSVGRVRHIPKHSTLLKMV
jgi:hypothetical protein